MVVSFDWYCNVISIIAFYKNLEACAELKCLEIIKKKKHVLLNKFDENELTGFMRSFVIIIHYFFNMIYIIYEVALLSYHFLIHPDNQQSLWKDFEFSMHVSYDFYTV